MTQTPVELMVDFKIRKTHVNSLMYPPWNESRDPVLLGEVLRNILSGFWIDEEQ